MPLFFTVEAASETGHSLTRLGPPLDVFGWGLLWVHCSGMATGESRIIRAPCPSRCPVKERVVQDAEAVQEQASTKSSRLLPTSTPVRRPSHTPLLLLVQESIGLGHAQTR
jgi:hypothetical protein